MKVVHRAAVIVCFALAACGSGGEDNPSSQTSEALDNLPENDSPTIYAQASSTDVRSAQAEFEFCATEVKDMEQAAETGNTGQQFNAASAASRMCDTHAEMVTEVANHAKPDFRITDCREATMSGRDYADGMIHALDAPTAENLGKVETLKSGFQSMAESCRSPDEYTLSNALK